MITTDLEEYLQRPFAPPAPGVLETIDASPIARPADALGLGDLDRLLDPEPLPVETGWCWTPERVAYVAVRSEMPGVSGEMWDWWFDWHPRDPLRYRIWYPGSHLDIAFEPPPTPGEKPHWGATHYPVEDVGLGRQVIRIQFRRPTEYGYSTDALADPRIGTIVGGFVGSQRERARVGVVSHVFLRDGDGVVLRSRFWLGGMLRPDVPGRVGDGIGWLMNRPPVRRAVLPAALPQRLARHCAIEYARLAAILPELHERYA